MNTPTIWQPIPSATNGVPDLASLQALEIPAPSDSLYLFVANASGPGAGQFYQLNLESGAPIDGFNVVACSLGGTARWLRTVLGGVAVPAITARYGVIWRPGEASASNHVATWGEVMAFIAATEGAVVVLVDDKNIVPTIPVGVWDLRGAEIVAYGPEGTAQPTPFGVQINIADGADLHNPGPLGSPANANQSSYITFLCFAAASGVRPFSFTPVPVGGFSVASLVMNNCAIYGEPTSTVPFFDIPPGTVLETTMNGENAYFQHDGAGVFMAGLAAATSTWFLRMYRSAQFFGTNLASGPAGSHITFVHDDTSTPPVPVGYAGIVTDNRIAKAALVNYVDTVPITLGATQSQAAIDSLKSRAIMTSPLTVYPVFVGGPFATIAAAQARAVADGHNAANPAVILISPNPAGWAEDILLTTGINVQGLMGNDRYSVIINGKVSFTPGAVGTQRVTVEGLAVTAPVGKPSLEILGANPGDLYIQDCVLTKNENTAPNVSVNGNAGSRIFMQDAIGNVPAGGTAYSVLAGFLQVLDTDISSAVAARGALIGAGGTFRAFNVNLVSNGPDVVNVVAGGSYQFQSVLITQLTAGNSGIVQAGVPPFPTGLLIDSYVNVPAGAGFAVAGTGVFAHGTNVYVTNFALQVPGVTAAALATLPVRLSGTTVQRPVAGLIPYVGFAYFDTTLGFPVFWNGAAWVNAAGVVS